MSLVTFNDVTLGYDGVDVIENLSFTVNAGDYLCIVGENGTGKSTLVKGLLGLKSPTFGEIIMGDELKHGEIGYLPQQTDVQRDFPASVREVVLSGCLGSLGMRPFFGKKQKQLAEENMRKLNILDQQNMCYRELSGGQQQRVLLARALCAAKKLLLLDEPTAGLDPRMTVALYNIISEINLNGMTIIMVSHDMSTVEKCATHVLQVRHKQIFFGTNKEYINSDAYAALVGGEANA